MRVVMTVILLLITLVTGCTLNFKGKEVELESQIVLRYELESIDFLTVPDQKREERRVACLDP